MITEKLTLNKYATNVLKVLLAKMERGDIDVLSVKWKADAPPDGREMTDGNYMTIYWQDDGLRALAGHSDDLLETIEKWWRGHDDSL